MMFQWLVRSRPTSVGSTRSGALADAAVVVTGAVLYWRGAAALGAHAAEPRPPAARVHTGLSHIQGSGRADAPAVVSLRPATAGAHAARMQGPTGGAGSRTGRALADRRPLALHAGRRRLRPWCHTLPVSRAPPIGGAGTSTVVSASRQPDCFIMARSSASGVVVSGRW